MKEKNFNNAHEITIQHEGNLFSGRYIVEKGVVTVTSGYGQRSTQLGGSTGISIAKILLRELVKEDTND